MIEAALFDLGDTLIHFETWRARKFLDAAVSPAYEKLRTMGLAPPSFERYRKIIHRQCVWAFVWSRLVGREVRLVHTIEKAHERMGIRLDDQHMADLMRGCIPAIQPYFSTDDDAIAVIDQLHQSSVKLGLVSNTFFPGFAIDDVLRHEGLFKYFSVRVYSSDARYMKPHPNIFKIALDRIGVSAEKTIYVGDRINKDIKGAARAGMKSILVFGQGKIPRSRVQPDYVIRQLTEIPAILKKEGVVFTKDVQAVA